MAKITLEYLKSKGLDDAVANEIVSNLSADYTENETLKEKYVSKETYNTEVKSSKSKLENYDKALKEIQKIVGADDEAGIATKIAELQTKIKTQDKEHKAELQRIERRHVSEKILAEMGALNGKAVTPFLTEIDANADIATFETMLKTQIEALRQGEDTKFLFKEQQQQVNNFKGANLADKGGSNNFDNNNKNLTLEQQMAIANQNGQ